MSDLMGFLGFILGICVALDSVVPARTKAMVARYASKVAGLNPNISSAIELSDKIFGVRLISIRSILASFGLTVCFTALMASIAGFMNPSIITEYVSKAIKTGWLGVGILFIAIISTILADFFSYMKARLLVRAMAEYKSRIVTAVVLAADILASLIVFSLIFAIGRTAIYVILATSTTEPVTTGSRIAPTVIAAAADSLKIDPKPLIAKKPNDGLPDTQEELAMFANPEVLIAARSFSSDEDGASAIIARTWGVRYLQKWDFVKRTHKVQCYADVLADNAKTYETYDAYGNSAMYLYALNGQLELSDPDSNHLKSEEIDKAVKSAFDKQYEAGPANCRFKLVQVTDTYDLRKMLTELDFNDLYLTALSVNLSQAFDALPTKFAFYLIPDLSEELPAFLSNSWRTRAIGSTSYDKAAERMSSDLRDITMEKDRAFLPFTTLVASSLGASALLWSVVLFEGISRLASKMRLYISEQVEYPTLKSAVFTSIALTLSLICIVVAGSAWLANILWKGLILLL